MKRVLNVSALALIVCATLSGPAWADSIQRPSIAVNGDASRPISQSSSQAAVDATYRLTINDAIDAARVKASSIAVKLGATLGPVLSFTENYGDASCPNTATVPTPALSGAAGSSHAGPNGGNLHLPPIKHHKRPRRHPRHAADDAPICTISAYITVSYQIA